MKTLIISILLLVNISSVAQYNTINLRIDKITDSGKYRFQNLQLYPIRANQAFLNGHKDLGQYVTLQEALEKKKVTITESTNDRAQGEVNRLFIENISRDTIMVLAGEVVQGGKQDRMISRDFLLYPKSGKKDVDVFCVEHGRWNAKEDGLSFRQYSSIPSNEVRKAAAVNKNQTEVWEKVAEKTEKNKAQSSTGTLTALQESKSFSADLMKYTDHFNKVLLRESDVIGVIAVAGDAILGCDMFATHGIFEKHFSNLINAYATEAITSGKAVSVSYEKVKEYLQTVIGDERKQDREVEKNGTMLKEGDKKIHISTFN